MTYRQRKAEEIARVIQKESIDHNDIAVEVYRAMQWQAQVCSIAFVKSPVCDVQKLAEIITNAGMEDTL